MFRMQLKRRAAQKTNYRKRLRLLLGRKNRIVVRRGLNNFAIQLVKYGESGDETLLEVNTKHLRQHGWKAHGGSVPSAYLTGFLFGKTAMKKGFDAGVIDFGLQSSKSQALIAAALGVRDAGMDVPVESTLDEKTIKGQVIGDYAKLLKNDEEKYRKQFSAYMKSGLDPESLPEHFEEVKKRIEEL